jgi:hypothetical protein
MKALSLFVMLFLSTVAFAKIWIVDSNPGSTAKDFTNLQAAHDGATAGDTLYLIGSPINYITTKVTVTKRLVIIGPGFFLNENIDTQANVLSAFIDNTTPGVCEELEFAPGSEGSVLMGVKILGYLTINADNILIRRNYIKQEFQCEKSIVIVNGSNVLVNQNYIEGNPGGSVGVALLLITEGKSGVLIGNNYFYTFAHALRTPATSSSNIFNNLIYGGIEVNNTTFQNNLIRAGSLSFATSLVRNNSASGGIFLPAGNNNESNVDGFSTAFVGTGSTDGRWQLTATSIFKGTGAGGVDRGMFGGVEPYVLSGIPPIPTIYSLTAPAIGEKNIGLPIQIKVKSNN